MARPMWSYPNRWVLVAVAALSLATGTTGQAATSISQEAFVQVDQTTVDQILDAFQQAETAITAGDLDRIMALYATQYNYHGLKQADIRKIWRDLFEEYRDLRGPCLFADRHSRIGLQRHHRSHLHGERVWSFEDQRPPRADRQLARRSALSDA